MSFDALSLLGALVNDDYSNSFYVSVLAGVGVLLEKLWSGTQICGI